jgi:hypothetical protein
VLDAESLQLISVGTEMRISKGLFAAIGDDAIQGLFTFDKTNDCYGAESLTWLKVEDQRSAKHYAAKAAVGFNVLTKKVEFVRPGAARDEQKSPQIHPVKNTRNWGV